MVNGEKKGEIKIDSGADETPVKIFQNIQQMSMSEKIKLASLGNMEIRKILIQDSAKIVQTAVINNPKITEAEVERIASSKSVDKEILRVIQMNREWMKNYPIKLAVIKNPKTPLQTTMRMISYLRIKDLRDLMGNRSVSNSLRIAAKKLYDERSA